MFSLHPVMELEGDGPWRITTANSTYHVRRSPKDGGWLVTRAKGVNAPTPYQGEDGTWRHAQAVELLHNRTMMFYWDGTEATLTSRIASIVDL